MIVFTRNSGGQAIVLAKAADDVSPANWPSRELVKYDQASYVSNEFPLTQGDVLTTEMLAVDPAALPTIEVRVTMTGGDELSPRGINLDDPVAIHVRAELHVTVPHPSGDGTLLDVVPPVTGQWRIPFAGSATLYRRIALVNGVAEFELKDNLPEGSFYPAVELFDTVLFDEQRYAVVVTGDAKFVVYRDAPGRA